MKTANLKNPALAAALSAAAAASHNAAAAAHSDVVATAAEMGVTLGGVPLSAAAARAAAADQFAADCEKVIATAQQDATQTTEEIAKASRIAAKKSLREKTAAAFTSASDSTGTLSELALGYLGNKVAQKASLIRRLIKETTYVLRDGNSQNLRTTCAAVAGVSTDKKPRADALELSNEIRTLAELSMIERDADHAGAARAAVDLAFDRLDDLAAARSVIVASKREEAAKAASEEKKAAEVKAESDFAAAIAEASGARPLDASMIVAFLAFASESDVSRVLEAARAASQVYARRAAAANVAAAAAELTEKSVQASKRKQAAKLAEKLADDAARAGCPATVRVLELSAAA